MINNDTSIYVAAISAVTTLIILIVTRKKLYADRNRSEAEASEAISQAAIALVEPLKIQIKENTQKLIALSNEVEEIKKHNKEICEGVKMLCYQIMALGHTPVYDSSNCDKYLSNKI